MQNVQHTALFRNFFFVLSNIVFLLLFGFFLYWFSFFSCSVVEWLGGLGGFLAVRVGGREEGGNRRWSGGEVALGIIGDKKG